MHQSLNEASCGYPVDAVYSILTIQMQTDKFLSGLINQVSEHLEYVLRIAKFGSRDVRWYIFPDYPESRIKRTLIGIHSQVLQE